jgi:hypothetical protein
MSPMSLTIADALNQLPGRDNHEHAKQKPVDEFHARERGGEGCDA